MTAWVKFIGILIAFLLLLACQSVRLTPQEAKVRVTTNAVATQGCKFVAIIQAKLDHSIYANLLESLEATLKKEAYAKGANIVFRSDTYPDGFFTIMRGEAYLCPE